MGYCDQSACRIAYTGLKIPNGLVRGRDGLIYVPSTVDGTVTVFKLTEKHLIEKFNEIKIPFPIDNLSVDKNGDIYAAAFPKLYKWLESSKAPFEVNPPTAVFRIRKSGEVQGGDDDNSYSELNAEYVVEKVLEDDGTVLPGSTSAVYDADTGRIFLAGVMSPYIAICEPSAVG